MVSGRFRNWSVVLVVAIPILIATPWILRKLLGTETIFTTGLTFGVLCLVVWGLLTIWRMEKSGPAYYKLELDQGGYWVYEPRNERVLEEYRSDYQAGFVGGGEFQLSGRRHVPKLFGPQKTGPILSEQTKRKIKSLAAPAVQITYGDELRFSKYGGAPLVPAGFIWPQIDGVGFDFLLQIDLSEFEDPRLPASGYLYFFEHEQRDGRVFCLEGDVERFTEVKPPQGKMAPCRAYNSQPIELDSVLIHATGSQTELHALGLDAEQIEAYKSFQRVSISNGLLGPSNQAEVDKMLSEYQDAHPESSKSNDNWKLLLELTGDDEVGFEWRNSGKLYFWIREEDLANRNFDRVRTIASARFANPANPST